jgi:DNA-binding transcriptional LysR family regulator
MLQAHALREGLGAAGLLSTQQLPCSDLELAKSLAFAGIGVTILSRRVAAADYQTDRFGTNDESQHLRREIEKARVPRELV